MFGIAGRRDEGREPVQPEMMPFSTLPAGTLPGQRRIIGTRKPPSSAVPLPPANGVWPPSGQVKFSAPLSVVKTTMVSPSRPLSLRYFITEPTMSSSCAMPASWMVQPFSELRIPSYFRERCVTTCMRVGLSQRKNGLPSLRALSTNLSALVEDLVVDGLHPLRIERRRRPRSSACRSCPSAAARSGRPRRSPSSGPCCAGRPCPSGPAGSCGGTDLPSRRGDRGSRRTRRSRGPWAGTRSGRPGGSCRTGRWRSPSTSAPWRWSAPAPACRSASRPGRPWSGRCGSGSSPVMKLARPAVQLASA